MEEIKQGYKQTDIGLIPKEWEVKSINEAFRFLSNATYSRAELNSDGDIHYIHYGDIHTRFNEFIDFNSVVLPKISEKQAKKYPLVQEGDILMADASEDYVGLCKSVEVKNIDKKKVIAGLHTILIREKASNYIDGFKGYLFLVPEVKKQLLGLATGMKVYGVSKSNLPQVLLPVPPLNEQTAIATALSDTDALISALDKKIAKKQQIKQGAMQLLLTGKKRLPGFSREWVEKKLGDVAEIKDGTHQTPRYVGDGIPFYSVESVTNNDFTNTKKISIHEHAILTKSYRIEKGDVLMTRIGSIGVCKYIDWEVDASFYVSLALIKFKRDYSAQYFCHYSKLKEFQNEIEEHSLQFATPKKINLGKISLIKIRIPVFQEEQTAIAQILTDMDNEIAQLEKERNKYVQLKAGMMQVLLTGKVRLVKLEN